MLLGGSSFKTVILFSNFLIAFAAAEYTAAPTVTIASGVLVGTTTTIPSATAVVNQFLGIPFAASPPERFSPPSPPKPWTTPKNVSAFTAACMQQFNLFRNLTMQFFDNPPLVESEDCLYLNVYVPSSPPPVGGRAIMFWLYGGNLQFGSAMQPIYDGSHFAAFQDVIFVAPNYRTNVFGFSNSPEIPLVSRNAGFLDQHFALQWVQDNIAAFGGDPNKVTIFGESAGAMSVDALILTNPVNPPFRAAIMESGQFSFGSISARNATEGLNAWNYLVANLSCPTSSGSATLSCVRAANATTIQSIIEHAELTFSPVSDNVTMLSNPEAARANGSIARVPVMIGSTSQEGRIFEIGQNNLTDFLETTFKGYQPLIQAIKAEYPVVPPATDYDVISQIFTDLIFTCPIPLYTASTTALNIPTWRYYFNASFPNTQPFPGAGVYHGSEILIVFATYLQPDTTAQESALSMFMQGAWANFAKNPTYGPGWNQVGTYNGIDMGALGSNGTGGVTLISSAQVDSKCLVFDSIYNATGVGT